MPYGRYFSRFPAVLTAMAMAIALTMASSVTARSAFAASTGGGVSEDDVRSAVDDAVGKVRSQSLRKDSYLEDRKAYFEALEKSEPLAGILSGLLGFGAGSFYAGSGTTGLAFMAAELGALGLILATSGSVSSSVQQGQWAIFGVIRAADLVVGVLDTGGYNEDLRQRMQVGAIRLGGASGATAPSTVGPGGISLRLLSIALN